MLGRARGSAVLGLGFFGAESAVLGRAYGSALLGLGFPGSAVLGLGFPGSALLGFGFPGFESSPSVALVLGSFTLQPALAKVL